MGKWTLSFKDLVFRCMSYSTEIVLNFRSASDCDLCDDVPPSIDYDQVSLDLSQPGRFTLSDRLTSGTKRGGSAILRGGLAHQLSAPFAIRLVIH